MALKLDISEKERKIQERLEKAKKDESNRKMQGAMSKIKLRIKMEKEGVELKHDDIGQKIDRVLLDKTLCMMMEKSGVKPMELDSILPPTSDIDWENIDLREHVYRVLIKRKMNTPNFEELMESYNNLMQDKGDNAS